LLEKWVRFSFSPSLNVPVLLKKKKHQKNMWLDSRQLIPLDDDARVLLKPVVGKSLSMVKVCRFVRSLNLLPFGRRTRHVPSSRTVLLSEPLRPGNCSAVLDSFAFTH
jgi:hypothetical protein